MPIEETAFEMLKHCNKLYNEATEMLKAKGATDEEIEKSGLHLHVNSCSALYGRIQHGNSVYGGDSR